MSVDLTLLHPELVTKIGRVLAKMQENRTPMKVCSGRRTLQEQRDLWAQGRSKPGRIVTYLDGVTAQSKHQLGEACDCCFIAPDPFSDAHPWGFFGDQVRAVGLHWGGDFKPHADRPHVELRTPSKVEVA